MEYWDPAFLLDIDGGIGEPLRIDRRILRKEVGTYAHVLVDVDFTRLLLEEILVQRERFEFLTMVEYENIPSFCKHCIAVGHDVIERRYLNREEPRAD